jgi:hypothetical protein
MEQLRACTNQNPPTKQKRQGMQLTERERFEACRGAVRPAAHPTWCLPGLRPLPHLGQWVSSVPCPRSRPLPRTSGGAR